MYNGIFALSNLKQSEYIPLVAYKQNVRIDVDFSYTRWGTTTIRGHMWIYNENIYTDYNIPALSICKLRDEDNNSPYVLLVTSITSYRITVTSSYDNAFEDGAMYYGENIDWSTKQDKKVVHEDRSTPIADIVENLSSIHSKELTGVEEATSELLYDSGYVYKEKIILIKIGERKGNGLRSWGVYALRILGSSTSSNITIEPNLIVGSETNKTWSFSNIGTKIYIDLNPISSSSSKYNIEWWI